MNIPFNLVKYSPLCGKSYQNILKETAFFFKAGFKQNKAKLETVTDSFTCE